MRIVVAGIVVMVALVTAGLALARSPSQQALIDSTVRFLQENQRAGGGFADPGKEPSQGISGWVALALAADGINPQDQARCGTDVFTYLVDHFREGFEEEIPWPQTATTAFERELLVVDATGPSADPRDFAGYDLVEEILGRQLEDGSFTYTPDGNRGESNDTIFAILALSPIHEARVETAIEKAAEFVVVAQDADGGWYYSGRSPQSEVDMTGAALEALIAAGRPREGETRLADYEAAIAGGLAYLRHSQLPDGGFPALPNGERESNVASTAWAVQGIWATGGNPEDWKVGPEAREPLGYMESMQQPDGHIRWRAGSDMNGIWMTAYVTPAFAGQALPVQPAAHFNAAASHGETQQCDESGASGAAPRPQEGVIAGGGGHGAPAFSRPRAQSKGKTPGGARVVRGQGLRAHDHTDRRRGANRHQPQGTEMREPRRSAEADEEAMAVSVAGGGPAAPSSPNGGGDDDGVGRGERGAPLPAEEAIPAGATTADEEVSGVVIGSPEGGGDNLAFGAPGLRSAGAGSGGGEVPALAIGGTTLLAALLGVCWERRRGVLR
jgi:hypothetical protein